jgi:hypothetical protein
VCVILVVVGLISGLTFVTGLGVGIALGLVALFYLSAGSSTRALNALGAREIQVGSQPRLENLVAGLSSDLSIAPPRLALLDAPDFNAATVGGPQPHLIVTSGLLASATRTELEAVVAHCLARLVRGGRGPVPVLQPVDDICAAAVTRYPPALAAAIRKGSPRPDTGGARWFVPAQEEGSSEERALEVLDL